MTEICTNAQWTHTTYQDTGALLVIVDGSQMECSASMLAALLYIDDIAILAHHTQRLDLVQLRGQVHRRLFLIIQDARIDRTVQIGERN